MFEVFHADNNKKTGYAALDSIKFESSPECEIIPPAADPSQSTTTPPITFPDCQFEKDECGWVKEDGAVMAKSKDVGHCLRDRVPEGSTFRLNNASGDNSRMAIIHHQNRSRRQ